MERILIYNSDIIDIRAHLFYPNATEGYIHNHGSSFISTWISGSYVHKIWAISSESSHYHYVHFRNQGGMFNKKSECRPGELENILCHPYSIGQSLYISSLCKHTVESPSNRVITISIRDKHKRFRDIEVWSKTSSLTDLKVEQVQIIKNSLEKISILNTLVKALDNFSKFSPGRS